MSKIEFNIRQETSADYDEVAQVIKEAFRTKQNSDHKEHILVSRLRNSDAFVPELSIIAEIGKKIAGHILLTKIKIRNERRTFESLALAPLSVKPEYQKQGIGGQLIEASHRIAKACGFKSIVVLGRTRYYPKFGYELIGNYAIKLPFEASESNCMVIELVKNGLKGVSGMVEYAKEFYD